MKWVPDLPRNREVNEKEAVIFDKQAFMLIETYKKKGHFDA